MTNSIRNKDGIWVNVNPFRQEAINFERNGYYCPHPWGSEQWKQYWLEQRRRCIEGYEVSGVRITGHHYYYLNFTKIKAINKVTGRKTYRFPDFWDGDYNFFWAVEIAKNGISKEGYEKLKLDVKIPDYALKGGMHILALKSRRKGFSFKSGAMIANTYHNLKYSTTLIGSFDDKYSKDTFAKAYSAIAFADEHTGFRKNRIIDSRNKGYIKSGYVDTSTGVAVPKGWQSEVISLTYKDNPDAARGKDATLVIMEEMGTFPNAEEAFAATVDTVKDGDYITGQMIMYGTSSNKEKMTLPFKKMFYNPELFDILPFENIWDEAIGGVCGYFHPVYLNKQGFYDENGNSDVEGAIESERKIRERKKQDSTAYINYIVENPMTPEEAFSDASGNIFPVAELQKQLRKVITQKLHLTKGRLVEMTLEGNKVDVKQITESEKHEPIWFYSQKTNSLKGVPIIYEFPIPNPPFGLYKIGYDPYAQDQSTSSSLAAIYVFKTFDRSTPDVKNQIVAEYVGRPAEADDASRIALMFAILYNTEVMHENMFIHVKHYFRKMKMLNRLAAQPDRVISKNIKDSKVLRVYGMHMNLQLKDAGEKYIKDWLLDIRDYDEEGNPRYNYEFIYSPGLLEELINYNRKGNFDRVMALMQVMFQLQEDYEAKYDSKNNTSILQEWIDFIDKKTKNYSRYGR